MCGVFLFPSIFTLFDAHRSLSPQIQPKSHSDECLNLRTLAVIFVPTKKLSACLSPQPKHLEPRVNRIHANISLTPESTCRSLHSVPSAALDGVLRVQVDASECFDKELEASHARLSSF